MIQNSGLFDKNFYISLYDDARNSGVNPLKHFVNFGLHEGRRPSAEFDPVEYLKLHPDVAASGQAALEHYIQFGKAEGRILKRSPVDDLKRLIEASGLFDARFYVSFHGDIRTAGVDPLEHFVRLGMLEGRRPSMEFDVLEYLNLHPDVAASGQPALEHYIQFGKKEGRSLWRPSVNRENFQKVYNLFKDSKLFDEVYYLTNNPVAAADGCDPILHYLFAPDTQYYDTSANFSASAYMVMHPELFSTKEKPLYHYLMTDALSGEEPVSRDFVRHARDANHKVLPEHRTALARMETASYFTRYGFAFDSSGPTTHIAHAAKVLADSRPICMIDDEQPDVSIVIPVYGQMPFILSCLDSLSKHKSKYSIEIIVADDRSPAEHRTELLSLVPWIRYRRNAINLGFLDNCNTAAKTARGRFLLLLNSDIRVVDAWLDELIDTFAHFPKAGFVGSKLLNPDGSLQEAGGVFWSDGVAWNYGRNEDERDPRYSFARQVDWVSGASIVVPMRIWKELDGFDTTFRPAYCEDTDLAFRIRDRGYEVWYQPLSRAVHFEGMTHGRDETSGIKAYQVVNLKRLRSRWANRLPGIRAGGTEVDREANRSVRKTMLVIDALTHTPDQDAGSVIGWRMLKVFRELGFQLTYAPVHGFANFDRYTENYQRIGVEMLYSPFTQSFDDVLKLNRQFDYILVHRYNIATNLIEKIRAYMPFARIIFVPADLHYLRMEREAILRKDSNLRVSAAKAKTEELAIFAKVDCSMPHTPDEKQIVLTEIDNFRDNVVVLPWIIDQICTPDDFDKRHDVMFLGNFQHTPNVDAVEHFIKDIWPIVETLVPRQAMFLGVGNAPPASVRTLASDRRVITGQVASLEPYFLRSRVFVAPLRYGAGIKGKVIDSLVHGVPIVATSIAMEGIGLTENVHYLRADSAGDFAAAVVRLYSDIDLWRRMRAAGLQFIEGNYSWNAAASIATQALETADETWLRREAERRTAVLRDLVQGDLAGRNTPAV